MTRPKLLLSWSGGKDSAWCLHVLRERAEYDVVGLLTTVNQRRGRVAMHDIRADLLQAQADAAGVPLWQVELPWPCANSQYEQIMTQCVHEAVRQGVSHMAFGDLFLQDIRAYRERNLAGTGLTPVFPLWGQDTCTLAAGMAAAGLQALIVCVDTKLAPASLAGRVFDQELLGQLPAGVDPCGENGEFHTLCFAGPMFSRTLPLRVGASAERDGYLYTDVELEEEGKCA
jgi:uncharacterized protein (TIGR00290 family)